MNLFFYDFVLVGSGTEYCNNEPKEAVFFLHKLASPWQLGHANHHFLHLRTVNSPEKMSSLVIYFWNEKWSAIVVVERKLDAAALQPFISTNSNTNWSWLKLFKTTQKLITQKWAKMCIRLRKSTLHFSIFPLCTIRYQNYNFHRFFFFFRLDQASNTHHTNMGQ